MVASGSNGRPTYADSLPDICYSGLWSTGLSICRSVCHAGPPGIPVQEFPGIPGNRQSLKFPAEIPGNFADFPKLSFFSGF